MSRAMTSDDVLEGLAGLIFAAVCLAVASYRHFLHVPKGTRP